MLAAVSPLLSVPVVDTYITKFPKIVLGIIKSDQVYHAHNAYHNATCSIRSDIVWDLLYGVDQRRLFVPIPRSHCPE
jgi:hypothetical protein